MYNCCTTGKMIRYDGYYKEIVENCTNVINKYPKYLNINFALIFHVWNWSCVKFQQAKHRCNNRFKICAKYRFCINHDELGYFKSKIVWPLDQLTGTSFCTIRRWTTYNSIILIQDYFVGATTCTETSFITVYCHCCKIFKYCIWWLLSVLSCQYNSVGNKAFLNKMFYPGFKLVILILNSNCLPTIINAISSCIMHCVQSLMLMYEGNQG